MIWASSIIRVHIRGTFPNSLELLGIHYSAVNKDKLNMATQWSPLSGDIMNDFVINFTLINFTVGPAAGPIYASIEPKEVPAIFYGPKVFEITYGKFLIFFKHFMEGG